ncbi:MULTISPECIES: Slam-dependent surface lipoprotein [unclassified Mannheimia]|uniref:Slam-dependent surface lipoprotein n=1 Tax=unclassified Mannheimia TaxID=2645054 RepID=UPI00359D7C7D
MMKMAKFSLSLVACAMIAACGSSGGSSEKSAQLPSVGVNSSPSTNVSGALTTSPYTGNVLVIKAKGDEDSVSISKSRLLDPNLNKISVDGKDIQINYPGISSGGWSDILVRDTALHSCCSTYSDVKFGAYEGGEDGNAYFFHNGNPTKDMPTAGTASYSGHVIIAGQTEHFEDEDYLKGHSQFTADFSNKKLSGTLNVDTMKPINVNANISNNNFTGTASSSDFAKSASVDGKFYGDNAKELGGVFTDNESWAGSFGAAQAK